MSRVPAARVCLGILLALPSLAHAGDVAPASRTWFGTIQDLTLRKHAPTTRFIDNAGDWETLWRAWKPADRVPTVDFTNHVILVATDGSRKIDRFLLRMGKDADLTFAVEFSHHKDFPGFTFGMAEVRRAGVKRIEGTPLK